MTLVQVFDPPLCCSTGVCGPEVDAAMPRFAADLEWLKSQGVTVERHNLAQEPHVFAAHDRVRDALSQRGQRCLPLVLVDGAIVTEGGYPTRDELAALVAVPNAAGESRYSPAVEQLVAIGAAIGANCEPCFRYHYRQALNAGVSREDIAAAVATARRVKEAAATGILKLAGEHLAAAGEEQSLRIVPCCSPSADGPAGSCC